MAIAFVLTFFAGFFACWFGKDWIKVTVNGIETEVRAFEDKIKALKAKL